MEERIDDVCKKQEDEAADDDDEDALLLPQDSFSILLTAPTFSQASLSALVAFAVQPPRDPNFGILFDSLSKNAEGMNYFGFPIDVSTPVRIAEYTAILITVFTQDDLIQALFLANEGYNERRDFRTPAARGEAKNITKKQNARKGRG